MTTGRALASASIRRADDFQTVCAGASMLGTAQPPNDTIPRSRLATLDTSAWQMLDTCRHRAVYTIYARDPRDSATIAPVAWWDSQVQWFFPPLFGAYARRVQREVQDMIAELNRPE